ncbi:unnamed protein product, partial [Heterosigma akashiwo]
MATFNAFSMLDSDDENTAPLQVSRKKEKKAAAKAKAAEVTKGSSKPSNGPSPSSGGAVTQGSGWDNKRDGEDRRR